MSEKFSSPEMKKPEPGPWKKISEDGRLRFDNFGDLNNTERGEGYDVDPETGETMIDTYLEIKKDPDGKIIEARIKDMNEYIELARKKTENSRWAAAGATKIVNNALERMVNGPASLRRKTEKKVAPAETNSLENFMDYIGEYFRDPKDKDDEWLESHIKWNLENFGKNKKGEKVFRFTAYLDGNRAKKDREKTVIVGTREEVVAQLEEEFGYQEPHLRVVGDED